MCYAGAGDADDVRRPGLVKQRLTLWGVGDRMNTVTVAENDVSIYEDGNLFKVSITDLLNNEVAVRQLVNNFNQVNRRNKELDDRVRELENRAAAATLQPVALVANAIVHLVGVLLVSLATNFLASAAPPKFSGWIMFCGIILSLLAAVFPIVMPLVVNRVRRSA